MFGKSFKRKYALTDKGVQNVKKGTLWTVIVNLIVMGGISVLYLLMNDLIAVLIDDQLGINTIMILILLIIFGLRWLNSPVCHILRECTLCGQRHSRW